MFNNNFLQHNKHKYIFDTFNKINIIFHFYFKNNQNNNLLNKLRFSIILLNSIDLKVHYLLFLKLMGTSISHTNHLDEIEAKKIRRLMKIKL